MKKHHVLVVEDITEIADYIAQALVMHGHRPYRAHNRTEAEQFLSIQDIDIVLLDYWMPGESASVFLRNLRRRLPNAKVVLTTAHFQAKNLAGVFGIDAVLPKPFTDVELIRCIENLAAAPVVST